MYNHGIAIKEKATSTAVPVTGTAGLQVIVGTAPVNLAEDPYSVTNRPILVQEFSDAAKAVGYSDDFKSFNICQSVDINFRVVNVAPLILINVLDPTKHKKALEEKEYDVADGMATVKTFGILLDKLKVKTAEKDLVQGTDYVASFNDDGYAQIILTDADTEKVTVSGDVIDPSMVTAKDIIGGYDVSTGVETGLEVIRQVFPMLNMNPGLILSPGWSKDPNVGAAIAAKCTGVSGVFTAEAIVDIDTTENGARIYTDVKKQKEKQGLVSEHVSAEWPCVKIGDKIYHASALKAAITAYTDANNGDVPNLSPSNKAVGISGLCLEDGTEVVLDEKRANEVNGYGVNTFNNFNGWVTWGNNSAIYPMSTDPKDRWFNCRRFFTWWGNNFILSYHQNVDDPNDPRQVEAIVDSQNVLGNSYAAQGKCAGVEIEFDAENLEQNVMNGMAEFETKLAPYPPMEYIVDTLQFSPELLASAFTGGDE